MDSAVFNGQRVRVGINTNPNALTIKDSTIHGMITSQCMMENRNNRTGDSPYHRLALTVDTFTIVRYFADYV
ncbi:hypothetical protein ER21_05065 [Cronobacter sakazakii]|nr:hypothetical protein ER21_05065 [Cronobacter sakazakii]